MGQSNSSTSSVPLPQHPQRFNFVSKWKLAWRAEGVSLAELSLRVWEALLADRIFNYAAELGFYFLFALFPTRFCAGPVLGFAARSAHQYTDRLLEYLALVIPTSALSTVLGTISGRPAGMSGTGGGFPQARSSVSPDGLSVRSVSASIHISSTTTRSRTGGSAR